MGIIRDVLIFYSQVCMFLKKSTYFQKGYQMKNRFSWQVTLLPIVFMVLTAGILSSLHIFELQHEKKKQIAKVTTEFIDQQKKMAKNRVMMASELIRFQANQTEELVRKRVKERVDEAIHIANAFYDKYHATLPRKDLEEQIKLMISHAVFDHPDGYFFAVDMNTERIIIHKLEEFVGYSMSHHKDLRGTLVLTEQKNLLSHNDGAFQIIYFSKPTAPEKEFPKQLYVRYFKPFNWLIGTGEYIDDMEKRLQAHVLERFKTLYTSDNEYLFIKKMHNLVGGDGKPYASLILSGNPIHRPGQALFDTDQDSKGTYFRKEILRLLRDHGQGFMSYWHPSPQHGHEVKKTSFFFYDKTWNWTIGSGFYYDDLERQLANIEENINARITKEIWTLIGITLLITIVMSTIFFVISQRIARTINTYSIKLEQAQRMESIGTLAGGIAHDFNNILFPILGHSEMLLDDTREDSPLRESLHEINAAALRAKDLVQQILTFARQEEREIELIKIQPIIQEALRLIRSTIPTTIEIKQNINPECGIIKADPTQVHQIIMNLATNAYHAMEEEGGVLQVTLEEIEVKTSDTTRRDMAPGVYAFLTVADTGTGMSKDVMQKIFDPFFTTRKEGKGTGMGLSVVHGIVKKMDGNIQVQSEPGKGTQFYVYFPVVKDAFEQHDTISNQEQCPGGSEQILLVDDEESIVNMGKTMLERLGYKVTPFTNSMDALESFTNDVGRFDVVITDLSMPNLPGDKLASEILRARPDMPIILNSGFNERVSPETAKMIGIKAILIKPVTKIKLAQTLRKVLDN